MKKLLLAAICAIGVQGAAQAAILVSYGLASTQNFDTLANTGTSSTVPTDWAFSESGTGGNTTYAAGTGSDNAGNTYSFGTTAGDRAFGSLQSGTVVPTVGASFQNNFAGLGVITDLTISYTGEQWRLGATGRTDRLDFQYSLNATSLTTGSWTDFNLLDFTSPVTAGTVGALDGNLAANKTNVSSTITGLSIAKGATIWVRWNSFDATSSDDGLAIDNFSITAIPEPSTYAMLVGGLGMTILVIRRKRISMI